MLYIADSAEQITNGFMDAFGYNTHKEFTRVMCWSHVYRNLQAKSSIIQSESDRDKIMSDIGHLQCMASSEAFDFGVKLFFKKCSQLDDKFDRFLDHFKSEWIDSTNSGWFEGAGHPSTDNGLEAHNGIIKRLHTLGNRMSVSTFIANSLKMIEDWSKDRCLAVPKPEKQFHENPHIDDEMWKRVWDYLYKREAVILQVPPLKTQSNFILTTKLDKDLVNVKLLKRQYTGYTGDFDNFVKVITKVKLVQLDAQWGNSSCTCPYYGKHYICYHILALAVNKGHITIPLKFKNVPIGQKPTRDRKPKATKALERQ